MIGEDFISICCERLQSIGQRIAKLFRTLGFIRSFQKASIFKHCVFKLSPIQGQVLRSIWIMTKLKSY